MHLEQKNGILLGEHFSGSQSDPTLTRTQPKKHLVNSLLAEVTLGSSHRNERDRVRLRERLSPEIIGTKDPSHKGPCCVCSSDLVSAKAVAVRLELPLTLHLSPGKTP